MLKIPSTKRGFIQFIILIIIALAILKFVYGITLRDIIEMEAVQDIWAIIKAAFALLWETISIIIDFVKELLTTSKDYVDNLNTK